MNTIVMNLETLGVTEHSPACFGVSGNYLATAAGVERAEGGDDAGTPITGSITFGLLLAGSSKQQRPRMMYVFHTGGPGLSATVEDSQGNVYEYANQQRLHRVARFALGRGVRDNYLKFGLNADGSEPFTIDKIDFDTDVSSTRRI